MFSHVMIGANDLEKSRKFYDAVLGALGIQPGAKNDERYFYRNGGVSFAISTPINGEPACPANGGTIGFVARDPAGADAFHAAGLANGGTRCEDPPGLRESAFGKLYLAYLRDPAGNKVCAMHRMR